MEVSCLRKSTQEKLTYEADMGVILPDGRGMPGQQAEKGRFMLKIVYPLCMLQPVVVVV